MRKRFEQRVSTTRLIGPRNIQRIHESELAADRPYYVAEYYEGKSPDKADSGQFFGNMHQATEVIGLYRTRADGIISRVAGIEPGARSIQRLERSRPCLRRTRANYGF